MKAATFSVCLLVAASAAAADPRISDNTPNLAPHAAPEYRIREVRFAGDPAFEVEALKQVLQNLKPQQLIPGIWSRGPRYDPRALEADLARLRSFYFSQGYFDARVAIADVTFVGREATVTVNVQSGPKFRVRHLNIDGLKSQGNGVVESNGEFPVEDLCKCLLDAKRVAEGRGRIDFGAELEVADATGAVTGRETQPVDVTARVRAGSAHTVGRISFSGHYRINESTIRRGMMLQERALFDVGKLRRSLERLNRSGLFEPLTLEDVEIQRNPDTLTADLTISLRERPRRHWSLSGPVLATRFTGSLQAAISSRLPAWGRGVFEASTYYVTFSLIGLPSPLMGLLPFAPKASPSPLFILERPYLPGQTLYSGFTLSPTRSATTLLASYGRTHLGRGVSAALGGDTSVPSILLVPVQSSRASGDGRGASVGSLICEAPKPRLRWLRRATAHAVDLGLGAFRPF